MSIEDYKARPIITLKLGPLKTYQIVTKQEIPGHSIKGGDL